MAAHGAQKALGWFEGPGPENAGTMMHGLGFRPGKTYAELAAWNEIASGALIAAGLGGPVGPAMLISNMIVAQTSVHWPNGFFAQKGGIELGVLYSAAALTFAATDFGGVSMDAVIGHARETARPGPHDAGLGGRHRRSRADSQRPRHLSRRAGNADVPRQKQPAAGRKGRRLTKRGWARGLRRRRSSCR